MNYTNVQIVPVRNGLFQTVIIEDNMIQVQIAQGVKTTSWLYDNESYEWFVQGYEYASGQTRAIPALSQVSPEDLYFAVTAIMRGAKMKNIKLNDVHAELETYGDLLKFLQANPQYLDQPIQTVKETPIEDEVQVCCSAIAIGTVKDFEFYRIRSIVDNKFRPDDLVILVDGNPFGEDGAVAYEMNSANINDMTPIYPKTGPTSIDS